MIFYAKKPLKISKNLKKNVKNLRKSDDEIDFRSLLLLKTLFSWLKMPQNGDFRPKNPFFPSKIAEICRFLALGFGLKTEKSRNLALECAKIAGKIAPEAVFLGLQSVFSAVFDGFGCVFSPFLIGKSPFLSRKMGVLGGKMAVFDGFFI
jgi:hypothetical protein